MTEETEEMVQVEDEKQEKQQIDENKQEWDKEKQRADQAEAVNRRLQNQLEEISEEHAKTQSIVDTLRSEIAEMKVKRQDVKDELAEMDESVSDPTLVRNLKGLNEKLKTTYDRLAVAEAKISQYEQIEFQKQESVKRDGVKEEVLGFCDEEFGAKYRNEASKLADKLVDDGDELQPKNITAAIKLLARCYKQVRDEESKKTTTSKKVTSIDTGQSGVSFSFSDDIKEGSLEEVAAQMRKKLLK